MDCSSNVKGDNAHGESLLDTVQVRQNVPACVRHSGSPIIPDATNSACPIVTRLGLPTTPANTPPQGTDNLKRPGGPP